MATSNPYDPTQNLGFGGVPATNPYTQAQGQAITNQANQNLQLNVLPGIASGAEAAGGFGGSRQGVAEGVAAGLNQQGISNSLANLYGNAYNQDENFYTQNRQLDQNGALIGANLTSQGVQGDLSQGQGVYNVGNTQQTAPWLTTNNASNVYNQYTGLGGATTTTQNGSALGALTGGALLGSQVISNLGLGSNSPSTSVASPAGSYDPSSSNYITPGSSNFTGPTDPTDPYGIGSASGYTPPQKFADGGPVRFDANGVPIVGQRTSLPIATNGSAGALSPQAILKAYMASRVPASAPNLGLGGLPTNPVTNPGGITAAQVQDIDKYAKGGKVMGRFSYVNGGAAKGGKPGTDTVPAWVDNGEHIVRKTAVTALGKGSNDKGQAMLTKMQNALDGRSC